MDKEKNHIQKKPSEFLTGESDNTGEKVQRIYHKSSEYVVYRTDKAIRVDFDDDSPRIRDFSSNHGNIAVALARIYSWLPEKLTWSEPINRQIARSIAANTQGKYEDAKEMLAHAESRIKILKTINGRLQYTISSFAMAGFCLLIMLVLSFYDTNNNSLISTYYLYSKIVFCGALGGVISVSLGFPKLEIDIDANLLTNCTIGASRIIISISAAVFSYFAIKSGVAFSFLADDDKFNGVYIAAMIAGFSEMLVPNIMANLSQTVENK